MSSEPGPVGAPGILIFRGSTFAIRDFSISLDGNGEVTSSMRPQVAWEMWPLWLRVAIDHEANARKARGDLLTAGAPSDDALRATLIEEETRAGMVTIAASAFSLEAMARSAASHAGLPRGIGANASAASRVAETLKQCFAVPHDQFGAWRQAIAAIFRARNEAVHPDADLRDPMTHPGVRAAVPRPAHVYRLENASASVETALSTALLAGTRPRPRLGRTFRERTSGWKQFADELSTQRSMLGPVD